LRAVRFEEGAEADLQSARRFYEGKRPGLGDEFFAAALSQCRYIASYPLAGRTVEGNVRKMSIASSSKFHFYIYYYSDAEGVVVVAVMHYRQHPDSWKKRR
jgi:plasmid stabilization system protein ParE